MNVHQNSEDPNVSHICNICGKQKSTKEKLKHHQDALHKIKAFEYDHWVKLNKRALREGVKYPCSQCDNKLTSKSSLAQHKRAVHEEVKYTCGQCEYKSTSKG